MEERTLRSLFAERTFYGAVALARHPIHVVLLVVGLLYSRVPSRLWPQQRRWHVVPSQQACEALRTYTRRGEH